MNQTLKRVLLSALFLTILLLGFAGLYKIFSWKDTSGDYFSCLEELESLPENTVDVVAVGPSKAYGSFNPAILWEREGISSFTLAISGMAQTSAYYHLCELLKTQSPKVVFVEASLVFTEDFLDKGNLYRNTIVMNPSIENIKLILSTKGAENKWDYLLRFPLVHGRYKELKSGDFLITSAVDKNCLGYINGFDSSSQSEEESMFFIDDTVSLSDDTVRWLDDMVELSRENDFELVFYMAPQIIQAQNQRIFNAAKVYLEAEGVSVLDLNRENADIGIDYDIDFSDGNHVNTYGAIKVSNWLSDYCDDSFSLEDHRGNLQYNRWDECLLYYNQTLVDHDFFCMSFAYEVKEQAPNNENILLIQSCEDATIVSKGNEVLFYSSSPYEEYILKLNETEKLYIKTADNEGKHRSSIAVGTKWYRTVGEDNTFTMAYDLITERLLRYCKE